MVSTDYTTLLEAAEVSISTLDTRLSAYYSMSKEATLAADLQGRHQLLKEAYTQLETASKLVLL